jgi:3-oxoacyl-[acyl-carrier-protein] synthase-3
MYSKIEAISVHLPGKKLSNDDLALQYEGWSSDKIEKKTGIRTRRIAASNETASDLGYQAAIKIFETQVVTPQEIDFILFCTESPDFPLPPSACLLQDRLNIPVKAGAFDFNLGCSGFVYGLGIAHGLIASAQAEKVLFITAETYSKYIHPDDKGVRSIFGDGAAATLITAAAEVGIGPFVYGTDGSGFKNLIVSRSNVRSREEIMSLGLDANHPYPGHLFMNGPEIFNFTIQSVPKAVDQILTKAGVSMGEVDHFVFHQANQYMLEHLRQKIGIPPEKFIIELSETGNTVSASIPIALDQAMTKSRIKPGELILLVGFGVGYSWAATLIRW